jgi:hypothetical protein
MHSVLGLEEMLTMASRETVRSTPQQPAPARPGSVARPAAATRDERARLLTPSEPLEAHWMAAIDAATD